MCLSVASDYDGSAIKLIYVMINNVNVMPVAGLNLQTLNIWWPKCEQLAMNANAMVVQMASNSHNPQKQ